MHTPVYNEKGWKKNGFPKKIAILCSQFFKCQYRLKDQKRFLRENISITHILKIIAPLKANVLHQDCVGVVWSNLMDITGNVHKQCPNCHQILIQMLLNPDWCTLHRDT